MNYQHFVVVGLGKTGLSCVRYLQKNGLGVSINDTRDNPPGLAELRAEFPNVPVSLGRFDEAMLATATELVVSPGISLKEPAIAKAIANGIKAIGDIELFARRAKAPVVAITGTNGKSTVTTLVGVMTAECGRCVQVGGNLGTPALDLLVGPEPELYVLELSSFQLETTYSLKPVAATILNITPDHLDRYETMADYIAAKQRIFQHCQTPIINRQDEVSYSGLSSTAKANAISFGMDEPQAGNFGVREKDNVQYLAYGTELLMPAQQLQIKGRHQIANALAALALGKAAGLPMTGMLQSLAKFPGLAHRCQWAGTAKGVEWFNDSKGTNVYSSLAAIEGLGKSIAGKLILIAGGLGKQQDFSPLQEPINKHVRGIVLIGQDAPQIAAILDSGMTPHYADNMQEAVRLAGQLAKPGDAVLLSPACASFDMFNNFEHRGDVFMQCVRDWIDGRL